jgi:CcmD family protein
MKLRTLVLMLTLMLSAAAASAGQPDPQSEFVPASEVPQSEQLPGGVFVVIAYGFIWVVLLGYVWSIWRRLTKVESEMRTLERRGQGGAAR